jgi:hypothetical protein
MSANIFEILFIEPLFIRMKLTPMYLFFILLVVLVIVMMFTYRYTSQEGAETLSATNISNMPIGSDLTNATEFSNLSSSSSLSFSSPSVNISNVPSFLSSPMSAPSIANVDGVTNMLQQSSGVNSANGTQVVSNTVSFPIYSQQKKLYPLTKYVSDNTKNYLLYDKTNGNLIFCQYDPNNTSKILDDQKIHIINRTGSTAQNIYDTSKASDKQSISDLSVANTDTTDQNWSYTNGILTVIYFTWSTNTFIYVIDNANNLGTNVFTINNTTDGSVVDITNNMTEPNTPNTLVSQNTDMSNYAVENSKEAITMLDANNSPGYQLTSTDYFIENTKQNSWFVSTSINSQKYKLLPKDNLMYVQTVNTDKNSLLIASSMRFQSGLLPFVLILVKNVKDMTNNQTPLYSIFLAVRISIFPSIKLTQQTNDALRQTGQGQGGYNGQGQGQNGQFGNNARGQGGAFGLSPGVAGSDMFNQNVDNIVDITNKISSDPKVLDALQNVKKMFGNLSDANNQGNVNGQGHGGYNAQGQGQGQGGYGSYNTQGGYGAATGAYGIDQTCLNDSNYILKTQIVPPVCPICPSMPANYGIVSTPAQFVPSYMAPGESIDDKVESAIKKIMGGVNSGIHETIDLGKLAIQETYDATKELGSGIKHTLEETGSAVKGTIEEAGTAAKSTIEEAGTAVKHTVEEAGTAAKNTIEEAGTAMKSTVAEAGTAVKNTVEEAGTAVKSTVAEAGTAVKNTVAEAGTAAKNTVEEAGTAVKSTVAEAGTAAKNTVGDVANAAGKGVDYSVNKFGEGVKYTVDTAGNVISVAGQDLDYSVDKIGKGVDYLSNTAGKIVSGVGQDVGYGLSKLEASASKTVAPEPTTLPITNPEPTTLPTTMPVSLSASASDVQPTACPQRGGAPAYAQFENPAGSNAQSYILIQPYIGYQTGYGQNQIPAATFNNYYGTRQHAVQGSTPYTNAKYMPLNSDMSKFGR